MKIVATILAVSAVLAVVSATGGYGGSAGGYGGASIPSPPCPNNYVFSCQANVAPVPCAPGYGSAGAYSENVPTVVNSPYGYQGVPQNLLHQVPPLFGQNAATH